MKRCFVAVLIAFSALLGFDHGWCSADPARPAPLPEASDPRLPDFLRERWGLSKVHTPVTRAATRSSVPGDELWLDGFKLPVTDGVVNAAINYQGSLVIAGRFTRIGDVKANNIARWNGTTWIPLGTGIEGGYVSCLVLYKGDLIAGGDFWYAGGDVARSVARWNGSAWSIFGQGLHDPNTNPRTVVSLAAQGDTLVATQDAWYEYNYPTPPSMPPPRPYPVNLWNGTEWVDLPGGNGSIASVAFYDGALFAAGWFDTLGNVPAGRIARWGGDSWSEVGGGLSQYSYVSAMVVHSGELVLGGIIDTVGTMDVDNVATWDGMEWGPMGIVPPVSILSSTGGDLFAGGTNMVTRWNGQSWEITSPDIEGTPSSIVTVDNDLVVAGPIAFKHAGDTAALSVARLSNGVWTPLMPLGPGMQGLASLDGFGAVGLLAAFRGHIVASGSFQYAGDPAGWKAVDVLAEWTGTAWERFPKPADFEFINGLLVESDTLYLAGYSNNAPLTPAIWRHDGTTWAPLGTQPGFVYSFTTYRGSVVAALVDRDHSQSVMLRWTGSEWEELGRADGSLYPLVVSMIEWGDKLVVAGRFNSINGVPCANIAAWNGSVWEPIGPGLPAPPYFQDGIVWSLGIADGRLAATYGGVTYWSGKAWEPLGSPLHGQANLLQAGTQLFATGYFNNDDFSREFYLVRWERDDWAELGSGTNGTVSSIVPLGNSIYMGGYFSEAGGRASYNFARWSGSAAPHATPTIEAARPNPFASSTAFSYTLPAPGTVRLSIHDVTGREIAVIDEGTRSLGSHTIIWYGRDRSGGKAPSGVYFLSATLPGGVHKARKVILLR